MKTRFVLLFLIFSATAFSQFRMAGTAGAWTSLGGGSYSTTITFFSDLTGNSYLPTQITTSFYLVTGTATSNVLQEFTITSATGLTLSMADLVVQQVSPTASAPSGLVMVFDPTLMNGFIPQVPFASAGATGQLQAAVDTYNARKIQSSGPGTDYITTDSFSTFIGGHTFASIATNKTVWRTTTGSLWQKTSSTVMTRRSTDNGLLASTIANTSNDTIAFNANLNNRVQMTTGNVSNAYVLDPLYYTSQAVGETFVIGVQAGTSAVTVNWSNVFGVYTGTSFNTMPTTIVPAQSVMTFAFRVITTSSEIVKFHYTDGIGSGSSATTKATNGLTMSSDTVLLGGTLNRNTTIAGGSKDFTFTGLKYYNTEMDSFIWRINGEKFFHMGSLKGTYNYDELAIGYRAGANLPAYNSTANTLVGSYAGENLNGTSTNGASNALYGYTTGQTITTGSFNSAFGIAPMSTAGTGLSFSCAFGHHSLISATGNYQYGYGNGTLQVSSGVNNSAFSFESLKNNSSGANNSGYGYQTLNLNTTQSNSSAMGYMSQANSVSISGWNTSLGSNALKGAGSGLATASFMTAVGGNCMTVYESAVECTGVGYNALTALRTGSYNTAIGNQALSALTTGGTNTALGRSAGNGLTTESGNLLLGFNVVGVTGVSNFMNLGSSIFARNINGTTSVFGINDNNPDKTLSATLFSGNVGNVDIVERITRDATVTTGSIIAGWGTGREVEMTNNADALIVGQADWYAFPSAPTAGSESVDHIEILRKAGTLDTVSVMKATGQMQWTEYGGSGFTGTPTRFMASDVNGNIIQRTAAEVLSDIGATPDNLGNHIATQALDMNSFLIQEVRNVTGSDIFLTSSDSTRLTGPTSFIELVSGFARLWVAGTKVQEWNQTDLSFIGKIPDNLPGAYTLEGTDNNDYISINTSNTAPRMILGSPEGGAAVGFQGIRYEDVQSVTTTGGFTASKSTITVDLTTTGTVTANLTGWPTSSSVASVFTIINIDATPAISVTVSLTGATWYGGVDPVLLPGESVNAKLIAGVLYPI